MKRRCKAHSVLIVAEVEYTRGGCDVNWEASELPEAVNFTQSVISTEQIL